MWSRVSSAAATAALLLAARGAVVPVAATGCVVDQTTGKCAWSTYAFLVGMGEGYSLAEHDLTKPLDMVGAGRAVFVASDQCIVASQATSQAVSELRTYSTTSDFASSLGFGVDASVGGAVAGFTASTTISSTFSTSSTSSSQSSSAVLRTGTVVAEYTWASTCTDAAFLDATFAADFALLPTQVTTTPVGSGALSVSDSSQWSSFAAFIARYGSHVITGVSAGALLEILATTQSNDQASTTACATKVCVQASAYGIDASDCVSRTSGSSSSSSSASVYVTARALGGDAAAASRVVSSATSSSTGSVDTSVITSFINTASSTTAMDYTYTAIWEVLGAAHYGTSDAKVLNRILLLQVFYEKVLADFRTQLVPDCWYVGFEWDTGDTSARGGAGHDHPYIDTITTATTPQECRTACQAVNTCNAWEFRPTENPQLCHFVAGTSDISHMANSVSGVRNDCGTKETSSFGAYDIIVTNFGVTVQDFQVTPCQWPVATAADCDACGNRWVTEYVKDYEDCSWWDCGADVAVSRCLF